MCHGLVGALGLDLAPVLDRGLELLEGERRRLGDVVYVEDLAVGRRLITQTEIATTLITALA